LISEHDEHEGMDEADLKAHEEVTKIKNIQNVLFGKHYMECWYFSPFPKVKKINKIKYIFTSVFLRIIYYTN